MIPAHSFSRREPSRQSSEGLDFTGRIRRLCEDMAERTSQLAHIDMRQVAVGFTQARKATAHGLYASLTPLRFAGGETFSMRRGRKWGVQRLFAKDGQEMLYVMTFYLPRFLNLPFREKLTTVMHELWHIGPEFDGDLRRFKGRCFAHGGSQKQFDAHVANLLDQWLLQSPPTEILDFLRCDFAELTARYGRVFGHRIRTPKLIPIS